MKPRRSFTTKPRSLRKTSAQEIRVGGRVDFSSYLSYAILVLYVLASVSSTKDEMLLNNHHGIQLPLVGVSVSVIGFYLLSPLIVLVGHLATLRQIPHSFSKLAYARPRYKHEKLNINTDYFMFTSLLLAGPVTLFLITYRFAAYQSPALFLIHASTLMYACHAAFVRYKEVLHTAQDTNRFIKWASCLATTMLATWLVLAADVIFLPTNYSVTLWLKTHTTWLDNEDGGAAAWIPHIHIDRATPLWPGRVESNDYLAQHSGNADAKEQFMRREVVLDVRSRNLRFLDISHQVIPRVWAHDADLSGANLAFTRLYGSVFVGTNLSGTSFDFSSLDGSTFMNMAIDGATFRHTRLKGSYWDQVELIDSVFQFANLSLSSLYGVNLNRVIIKDSDLTGISLYETRATELAIRYTKPFEILTAIESNDLIDEIKPIFKVAPKVALEEIAKQVCHSNIDLGWAYAWINFLQLKSMVQSTEPEIVSALQELFKLEQCMDLPDYGLREQTDGSMRED